MPFMSFLPVTLRLVTAYVALPLEEQCRQAPSTPSSTLQVKLQERFDLRVSSSQINRVRAALGISNRPQNLEQGKKRKEKRSFHLN
jgi:hypothetical protein